MKKTILPITILTGIIIGSLLKGRIAEPTYLTVSFEDNHYEVAQEQPTVPVVTEVKAAEPEVSTPSADIQGMLNYIHMAESTKGKNNTPGALHLICRSQGKWNELGYGGMRLKICFENEAEGMAKVGNWLERHLQRFDGDVAKTLCYYNLGEEQVNCKYYQKYLGAL